MLHMPHMTFSNGEPLLPVSQRLIFHVDIRNKTQWRFAVQTRISHYVWQCEEHFGISRKTKETVSEIDA